MLKISELLKDPERHCVGHFAYSAKNRPVKPWSAKAVKWCLVGALAKCYPEDFARISLLLKTLLLKQGKSSSLIYFNDDPDTTHEMILDLVKMADV